jgi:phytoene dehydrogenase-like protein
MKRKNLFFYSCFALFIASLFLFFVGCGGKKAPDFEADYDVIIVGGGMGGLSAGAHLASKGLHVLLLEQHHKVGGCATNFTRGDFTFETALHLMAGGGPDRGYGILNKLLNQCGVYDKVELYPLEDYYRSVFPGTDVRLPENWDDFESVLKEEWPEEAEGVDKFHKICTDFYTDLVSIKDLYRYHGFKAFLTKAQVPLKQRNFFKWQSKTFQDVMDECFTSEDIKIAIGQAWVYFGPPPSEESAIVPIAATELMLTDGLWHVMGTSQALSNAYAERIRELGGDVKIGTLVTEIIIEDGLARGVKTEYGDVYTARYIVCNTDPYQMVFKLIGEENFPKKYVEKITGMKTANSLLGIYLGLNIDLAALGYTDGEILYSSKKDADLVYENMMNGNYAEGAASISIYSNYDDPIYAPPGKSLVVLDAYSDYNYWPSDPKEYQKLKEEKAWEQIRLVADIIPEIADPKNIEEMVVMTPLTIEEFTMNHNGVIYGFYLDTDQWQKIPNDTPIENVFIAGNWTQGWHGFAACQINGWRAATLISDIEGIE